jgi:glyoxylase-like metal-dependent hydrolase (beta-lactamase superfamily II)
MTALAPLAPGVLAWLAERPGHGRANAGVVIDEDGVTLIDSLAVPSQWDPFAADVDGLGFPIRRVVLTSSNAEFAGGTARFRLAAVFGRPQASTHLDQPADPALLRRLYPDVAGEIDDEYATRPVSHVVDAPVQLTPALAAYPMSGQQAENLVVLVPGAQVLFAGAMCAFGVTPLAHQGDPAAWADQLDQLVELAPIIVPGHGPIGGEEEVRLLQAYLRACVAAEGDAARIPPGPWDDWVGRENDAINVERAAMLARGDDGVPPSLLRRLGLT